MSFVWSIWYVVALVLVAGIAACLIIFFKMDKQDKVIIEKFVKEQAPQEETKESVEVKAE